MEAVIFCGVQGSGKSTFYQLRFFNSHVRISLDLLRTRNKEAIFLHTCFATHQRFVVDNTNPTQKERRNYIEQAKFHKYKITGYFFDVLPQEAWQRNCNRQGKACVPEKGFWATYHKLQALTVEEGFDRIYRVQLIENRFMVEEQIK